jgi:hypothetical protein
VKLLFLLHEDLPGIRGVMIVTFQLSEQRLLLRELDFFLRDVALSQA